jgi:hypothetical protein
MELDFDLSNRPATTVLHEFTIENSPFTCSINRGGYWYVYEYKCDIYLFRMRVQKQLQLSLSKLSIRCSCDYVSLIDQRTTTQVYEIHPVFYELGSFHYFQEYYDQEQEITYRYFFYRFPPLKEYQLVRVRIVISSRRILKMKELWNLVDTYIYWIPEEVLSDILNFIHFEK